MDNLVLIRVAQDFQSSLRGAILREFRQEAVHRFRLLLEKEERTRSVLVSLRPEMPWIGRPAGRWEGVGRRTEPFSAAARRILRGEILRSVEKPGPDRAVFFRFAQGDALVAELATHGANLILLDRDGNVVATARNPRSARRRLAAGTRYAPPSLPRSLLVPDRATAEEIDRHLAARVAEGETEFEALRRHVFGIGTAGARLILAESRAGGSTPGEVTRSRLDALFRGEGDPVVESAVDPRRHLADGRLDRPEAVLWPWEPPGAAALHRRDGPAGTAGLYHEMLERADGLRERLDGLGAVLRREVRHLQDVREKVQGDVASFEDPERFRRWGEALLAGMHGARRVGEHVFVADPYDPEGNLLEIPAPAGHPLATVAQDLFVRHRRAVRGLEAARRRGEAVETLQGALDRLVVRLDEVDTLEGIRDLERAMREAGIPVGLESPVRRTRGPDTARPRVEGVRLFTSSEGVQILAGKGGRQNDRLTFKLAGPEDFWFHALGWPGAHVVVRNPERRVRPTETTLLEAAAVAAWYSDAREQGQVEVQWTRRKFVRRMRGAPPGTVKIKRSETVRVRPGLPARGEIDS